LEGLSGTRPLLRKTPPLWPPDSKAEWPAIAPESRSWGEGLRPSRARPPSGPRPRTPLSRVQGRGAPERCRAELMRERGLSPFVLPSPLADEAPGSPRDERRPPILTSRHASNTSSSGSRVQREAKESARASGSPDGKDLPEKEPIGAGGSTVGRAASTATHHDMNVRIYHVQGVPGTSRGLASRPSGWRSEDDSLLD